MAGISDRAYTVACGRLASRLGVSLASARRRVEIKAAQQGLREPSEKLALAESLLAQLEVEGYDSHAALTAQLGAVGNDDRFMTED